jgi:3-phosphoshikimate 1-carboxyvinyltransferase
LKAVDALFSVTCPSDKSITHRVLFLAAMARGRSRIFRPLVSGDTRATMNCLGALGVRFHETADAIEVDSPGIAAWQRPAAPLFAGNSGTTARFLAGVLSACPGMEAVITGDASLSRRPMRRVLDLLGQAGANVVATDTLPVTIKGTRLKAFDVASPHGSAQVKTAMTLAALTCDGESRVTLPDGSRNHTEILCAKLGLPVSASRQGGLETVTISGPAEIKPFEVTVPGDPSSAAFLVAAGLLSGRGVKVTGVCGNPLRSAFLDVLDQAGVVVGRHAAASQDFSEPSEDWEVEGLTAPGGAGRHALRPAGEIPAAWVPAIVDEIPVLATILAFAPGPSVFRGVAELRVKESDRFAATVRLLRAAGCPAHAEGDDLVVPGGLKPSAIEAFDFDPERDHRLAMCAMVLESVAQKSCNIPDRSCVEVSFPSFEVVLGSINPQSSVHKASSLKKRGILS